MTPFNYYADPDVDEDAKPEYPKIPSGERFLKVINWTEAKPSQHGDPCILLDLEDMQTSIKMKHWLYLLPKGNPGHGITKRFLKILEGNTVAGNISIDPDKWLGKIFKSSVVYKHSKKDPDVEFAELVIASIKSLTETDNPDVSVQGLDSDIPF